MKTHRRAAIRLMAAGVIAGLTLAPHLPASSGPGSVFRTLDWESAGDRELPSGGWDFIKHTATGHGATVTTTAPRDGSHAVQFDLRKEDPMVHNGTRAELSQHDSQPVDAERWYGFSINLDPSWTHDRSAEIVSQWHDCDDSRCGGGSPPLALLTDEGRWKVDFQGTIIDLGDYQTGRWTDWVFHVRWRTDSTGVVEAWRDGQLVLERSGATYDGGPRSPYFKFGIYKWDWGQNKPSDTTRRLMTYDSLRLGDETATRQDVDPAQGGSVPGCTAPAAVGGVTASTEEPSNPASNALDGDLATRWSGQGSGAALVLDLGSEQPVCGTDVAWHRGDLRWNDYTVYTSVDNSTWVKAWEGRSSGATTALERQTFEPRSARYVRISFWQNPENDWASITEVRALAGAGAG